MPKRKAEVLEFGILDLCQEITCKILKNLDFGSVLNSRLVCKQWLTITQDRVFWKYLFENLLSRLFKKPIIIETEVQETFDHFDNILFYYKTLVERLKVKYPIFEKTIRHISHPLEKPWRFIPQMRIKPGVKLLALDTDLEIIDNESITEAETIVCKEYGENHENAKMPFEQFFKKIDYEMCKKKKTGIREIKKYIYELISDDYLKEEWHDYMVQSWNPNLEAYHCYEEVQLFLSKELDTDSDFKYILRNQKPMEKVWLKEENRWKLIYCKTETVFE